MSPRGYPDITDSLANLSIINSDLSTDVQASPRDQVTPSQPDFQLPSNSGQTSSHTSPEAFISGSDTETESPVKMPSGSSSKHHSSSSSSKHHSSSSSSKHHSGSSKHSSKKDDWAEVTEPEERRRIQNRIAQRKFPTNTQTHNP
ncbi:hypothetical protein BD289DRAFT_105111 [Coniella lustricola]|uniref:BZIP domain-containing protein n=1 Tax=Coniella lustricola TaxID=2025994 RepID=A0A2T2ZXW2_9PEZI|nr:hypothetical protein BD289DRAFT_105111 [Coniella lustricola]